ncbi:MAG: preprotein translocase subunit YajC [Bacteroidales bacterium]|nr:preprotein translocase subunit YajC [Bacteroidales bacterium]
MNLSTILLQAAATPKAGLLQNLFLILIIIVIFYFFLIRPQMKRNKEQQQFRNSLQKGQKVVTIGGLHGRIAEIQDNTVTLEVDNVKMKFEKSAIASSNNDQLNTETK